MSSSLPAFTISAGKSRRLRAAATKRKLYEASQTVNPLMMMSSQMAMLTTSIDTLLAQLTTPYFMQQSNQVLNASAQTFVPATQGPFSEFPVAAADRQAPVSESGAHGLTNLTGQWESLDDLQFNMFADRVDDAVSAFLDQYNLQSALAQPVCCDEPTCFRAQLEAMVEKFKDEDVPQYSTDHMHVMIQGFVDIAIRELSEEPRWQGVPDDVVPGVVAKLRSSYVLGDGSLYTRSQARELAEDIGRLCRDVVTPFLATDSCSTPRVAQPPESTCIQLK